MDDFEVVNPEDGDRISKALTLQSQSLNTNNTINTRYYI
jgi:hypothetical protein